MSTEIRDLRIEDYVEAKRLWETTEGVGLSEADSRENIARFLERNIGLSFVGVDDAGVVGTILCGHDGRRGLIHHLVVSRDHRRQGLGRALVSRALSALYGIGIQKCHLLAFRDNAPGLGFWRAIGGDERTDLATFSLMTAKNRA